MMWFGMNAVFDPVWLGTFDHVFPTVIARPGCGSFVFVGVASCCVNGNG